MPNTTATLHPVPTVTIEDGALIVRVMWEGGDLDRRDAHAWSLGADSPRRRALGDRLVAAVLAGAILPNPEILTDVNGKTYAHATSTILGRTMNADLTRMGF